MIVRDFRCLHTLLPLAGCCCVHHPPPHTPTSPPILSCRFRRSQRGGGRDMYLTGSTDRTAKLWDLDRGELLTDFTHHHQSILTVSASMAGAPDELFFLASHDRTASAVSPVTGEVWFPWAQTRTCGLSTSSQSLR